MIAMNAFEHIPQTISEKRSTVMGGLGSGRPSGSGRSTVESCRAIDVNKLQREGCLKPGWSGGWQWTKDGKQTGWVGLKTSADHLRLTYKVRIAGGDWQDVEEDVLITRESCRFGGTRAYLVCPGVVHGVTCNRRVVKLHGGGRYFLCRHCYRLAYASQSEGSLDRTHRRVRKVRRRLGGTNNLFDGFPARPKGMWERTYRRLRDSIANDEIRAETMFVIQGQQLLDRIDRHSRRNTGRKEGFWT